MSVCVGIVLKVIGQILIGGNAGRHLIKPLPEKRIAVRQLFQSSFTKELCGGVVHFSAHLRIIHVKVAAFVQQQLCSVVKSVVGTSKNSAVCSCQSRYSYNSIIFLLLNRTVYKRNALCSS